MGKIGNKRERTTGNPAALLKEEFYEKISKIRYKHFLISCFLFSTYEFSIELKCDENVFKIHIIREQFVTFFPFHFKHGIINLMS